MVIKSSLREKNIHLAGKAKNIKIVLTDNDGVLTDTGVFYSDQGEVMKRFSIRDGMGVERLRNLFEIETGIITGELSASVRKRAEKLQIKELHLGAKDKVSVLNNIIKKNNLSRDNIAFIGDDVNDIELMKLVGLTASPSDGMPDVRSLADYVCEEKGGHGAFREFAELIIALRSE